MSDKTIEFNKKEFIEYINSIYKPNVSLIEIYHPSKTIIVTEHINMSTLYGEMRAYPNQLKQFTTPSDSEFHMHFKNIIFKDFVSFNNGFFDFKLTFNVIFEQKVDCDNAEFHKNIIFYNSKFKDEANFSNNKFLGDISFQEAEFSKKVDFSTSEFKGYSAFIDTKFYGLANFRIVKFESDIVFSKAHFTVVDFSGTEFTKEIAKFNLVKFHEKATFTNTIFHNIVDFYNTEFHTEVTFEGTEFKNKVHFNEATFIKNASFQWVKFQEIDSSKTIFKGDVTFDNIEFEDTVSFEGAEFQQELKFNRVEFKQEADFQEAVFNKTSFDFAKFKKDVDFKRSKFNGDISFTYTTFMNNGAFADIPLLKTISFYGILLNDKSHIYFYETNKDLKDSDIKDSKITITNTVINGRIDFNSDNIKTIDLKGSDIIGLGTLNLMGFDPKCENYQTATILKNEAIKRNNIIKALEYKAEEKKLYAKALKHHAKEKIKSIFKKTNQPDDKNIANIKGVQWISEILSILLSRISNNHGQNWIRAVIFTIGIWIIFFGIFYAIVPAGVLNINQKELTVFNLFAPEFFKYLIPTDYKLLVKYVDYSEMSSWLKALGASVYFVGKIFIAYGVFETIEAFRKFNKIS